MAKLFFAAILGLGFMGCGEDWDENFTEGNAPKGDSCTSDTDCASGNCSSPFGGTCE